MLLRASYLISSVKDKTIKSISESWGSQSANQLNPASRQLITRPSLPFDNLLKLDV